MWRAIVLDGASTRRWQCKQTGCKYALMHEVGKPETNQATPWSRANLRQLLRFHYGQTELVDSVWPWKCKHDYTCFEWPREKVGQVTCCQSFPLDTSRVEYWELRSPYFLDILAEIFSCFLGNTCWHVSACVSVNIQKATMYWNKHALRKPH